MSDQEEENKLKIKDRRRFDAAGNEKPGDGEEKTAATGDKTFAEEARKVIEKASEAGQTDSAKSSEKKDASSKQESYPPGEIDLSSFVMSLATQALMQLGEMKPPEGVQVEVNKAQAKQTIDILIMIQEKTRGNLDANEEKFLEEILHQLRISFVRHS